jgi:hypothetical protein
MATTQDETTDSIDTDKQYWTPRGKNESWIVHSDRDCYHLERAGAVRPVEDSELADARLCERCAGIDQSCNDGTSNGGCPFCETPDDEITKLAYHLPECPGGDDDG